jgi:hypothetical protein
MENNRNALADMELEDNFFDQNLKAEEDAFQAEFEQPGTSFNRFADKGIAENALEDGETPPPAPDTTEAFEFDNVMAEEEAKELAELNAKMGTNFESRNELNEALKQIERSDQSQEIQKEKRYINYFSELLDINKYSDASLVREDKKIALANAGKDPSNEDELENIDREIARLEDSGALSYAANSIRDTLRRSVSEKSKVIKDFEDSQKLTAKQREDKYKQDLQEGINAIYKQGKFLGIQPTKEDMLDIYKDISKNKHLEHLKAHPKDAVSFALFKKYQSIIEKNLSKPNYEAGVKNTLSELGMSNSSQTGTSGKDITKDSDAGELTFLQRFAK